MAGRVQFSTATGGVYDAGSYAQLRLTSDTIYGLPEDRVLARDVNHRWITAQGEFLRLDVIGPLNVHFEGGGERSKVFGPYEHFSSADGISYVDRAVFAFADHTNKQWFVVPADARWAVMVVTLQG